MSEKIIITFPDGNKKEVDKGINGFELASQISKSCLLYTSPSPRDVEESRMPSSA